MTWFMTGGVGVGAVVVVVVVLVVLFEAGGCWGGCWGGGGAAATKWARAPPPPPPAAAAAAPPPPPPEPLLGLRPPPPRWSRLPGHPFLPDTGTLRACLLAMRPMSADGTHPRHQGQPHTHIVAPRNPQPTTNS